MHPKFKFQNGGRIWKCSFKKSCRTFDFEQLLFLEIFNFRKFGSNLNFKTDGNSVILGEQYTATAPLPASFLRPSRRARGHPQLHAGTGCSLHVVPSHSWPCYKAPMPSSTFFSLLCFPTPPPQLRRAPLDSSAQASLGKAVFQLHLLLANPSHQLWLSESTENRR